MGDLYQQICNRESLNRAWLTVRDKGSGGGIDGVSVTDFEHNFDNNIIKLQDELISGNFSPLPYKEIKIPKAGGDYRSLGLMSVRDKVVQQAVRETLEPLLDRLFLDVSYGYRKNKGTAKAISRVKHLIVNEKRDWLTACDINNYFDSINHDRLMAMLSRRIDDSELLALIRVWIKMGKVDRKQKWKDSTLGIPQGGLISPLLSNFYLNSLDHFAVDKKYGFIRYADDFVILSRSRDEAENVLIAIQSFLNKKLKLSLNPGAEVRHLSEEFTFLGVTFAIDGCRISEKKLSSIRNKISKAVIQDQLKETQSLTDLSQGLLAYYAKVLPDHYTEKFDVAIADALKKMARQQVENGTLKGKKNLISYLKKIQFLSAPWQVRRNKEIREIADYAFRKTIIRENHTAGRENSKKSSVCRLDPVAKRKRQYQKLESDGFELVVSRPGSFVGKNQKGIVVKVRGQIVHQAPLNQLKHIMITSPNVSLSGAVIRHAVKNRIPIDFIEYAGLPYARVSAFQNTNVKLQLAQLEALKNGRASLLAILFVKGKIRNQQNLMKYFHKYRKTIDGAFAQLYTTKMAQMKKIEDELIDLLPEEHDTLRGKLFSIEGRSASIYWDISRALLEDVIYFEGRTGQGANDLVNSLLNYGYGILYSKVWQAVARTGLNPHISYLHVPQQGKPTLIFDLIEEFRSQAVDRVVFSLINRRIEVKMEKGQLALATRNKIAKGVLERINVVEHFRGRKVRLGDIIIAQTRAVANFLDDKKRPRYRPYIGKW